MKILIADKLDRAGVDRLQSAGLEVLFEPELGADDLSARLTAEQPDILLVRSTKVKADAMAASQRLKLVIRAGAGYDNIDVAAASRDGIYVANCPGKNGIAVAELAWGLILSCDRRIPDQTADLRSGQWNKKKYAAARGLYGRTIGLLGLGTIGTEVARRALAFGMHVVAWSRSLDDERAHALGIERAESPADVARRADLVSIHLAATPDTTGIVDATFLDALKPGTYLINTSRGSLVDEEALARAVREKGLRVGLDVYANEPGAGAGAFDCALAAEDHVYGTHHVGASTDQAQQAIAAEAVRIVERFAETGEVLHCVNRARKSDATCLLTVRHHNRPGVLAQVFQILSEAGINVEEMENVLYEGLSAACARIQLQRRPAPGDLARLEANSSDILGLELTDLESQA